MKKILLVLILASLSGTLSFAQCPFTLGPNVMICAGSSIVLQGPVGVGAIYTWSTGATTPTIIVTTPGVYWLSIFDGTNTCGDTVIINMTPSITISLTCINNSCSMCTDGSITAIPSGGIQPFNYFWSNGATVSTLTAVAAGTYTVTITDGAGCTESASCDILTGPIGTGPNLISGNVFFDTDSNGIKGPGENGVPFMKITLSPDGLVNYTDTAGDYAFLTDTGSKVVSYVPTAGLTLTSGSGSYNIQVISGNYPGNDFSVNGVASGGFASTFLNGGNPRCGNSVLYTILCNTYVNAPTLNGSFKLVLDTAVTFNNSNPAPTLVSGDTITWNFTAGMGINQFQYECHLQIPPQAGYPFYTILETELQDTAGAVILTSFDSLHQVVACSMDPNDKSVVPEGSGPQHYVFLDITPTLDYTIRFQNTGNDTAYTVVILDTLDQVFDLSTFNFQGSSHPVAITLLNNLAEFRFDNIYLPDSNVNEPASHGFVSFSCNPVYQGSPYALENSAAIYFDINAPVITNTTLSTIEMSVGIPQLAGTGKQTVVYPNPFSDEATILFENPSHALFELYVYDVSGRTVTKAQSSDSFFRIEAKDLNAGVYFYRIQESGKAQFMRGKFVVVKAR